MPLDNDLNKLENLVSKSKELEDTIKEIESRQSKWNESVKEKI